MKAVKVLNSALNCCIDDKKNKEKNNEERDEEEEEGDEEENESNIVLACSELVANDVRDLFTLFHVKLLWILREERVGDVFEGWDASEVKAILSHLKTFYCDR